MIPDKVFRITVYIRLHQGSYSMRYQVIPMNVIVEKSFQVPSDVDDIVRDVDIIVWQNRFVFCSSGWMDFGVFDAGNYCEYQVETARTVRVNDTASVHVACTPVCGCRKCRYKEEYMHLILSVLGGAVMVYRAKVEAVRTVYRNDRNIRFYLECQNCCLAELSTMFLYQMVADVDRKTLIFDGAAERKIRALWPAGVGEQMGILHWRAFVKTIGGLVC